MKVAAKSLKSMVVAEKDMVVVVVVAVKGSGESEGSLDVSSDDGTDAPFVETEGPATGVLGPDAAAFVLFDAKTRCRSAEASKATAGCAVSVTTGTLGVT